MPVRFVEFGSLDTEGFRRASGFSKDRHLVSETSKDFRGILEEFQEIFRDFQGLPYFPTFQFTKGFPRISKDFQGFPRISKDFQGFPRIPKDFKAYSWILFAEPRWISKLFQTPVSLSLFTTISDLGPSFAPTGSYGIFFFSDFPAALM